MLPPGSACEGIERDIPEIIGYDMATRVLLNISDWSQGTMITAGNWGKKGAPKFEPEIRPWLEKRKQAKASEGMDIKSLHAIFMNKASQQRR